MSNVDRIAVVNMVERCRDIAYGIDKRRMLPELSELLRDVSTLLVALLKENDALRREGA